MIFFNSKGLFSHIFEFHKKDTLRILFPFMALLGMLTGILVFIESNYYQVAFKSTPVFHSIIGFVLSMLLVFRINTAYDRWWEGRKMWGTLINNSRNLAIQINAFLPREENTIRTRLCILINNYIYVTKDHLRGNFVQHELEECDVLAIEEIQAARHKPNRIARQLFVEIHNLLSKKLICSVEFQILNENLKSFIETTGACERIRKTPIPHSYRLFLKKIIFIYVFTMPIVFSIEFGYWGIPPVMFIFYTFASLELLSAEIEDPFGGDSHDLPTHEFAAEIKSNLQDIVYGK